MQFDNIGQSMQSTPLRMLQRNLSFDCTTPMSPNTPSFQQQQRPFWGHQQQQQHQYSPGIDQPNIYGNYSSRSNSPADSDNSGASNIDNSANITDLMNYLSLAQSQQQLNDFEMANIQNLQALNAIKLLKHHQQQQQQKQQLKQQQQQQQMAHNSMQQQLSYCNFNQMFPQGGYSTPHKNYQVQQTQQERSNDPNLDRVARLHRSAAALCDANCTWSGILPARSHTMISYSPKVFLGGIPWDISEQSLITIFKPFGNIKVEWPGKEQQACQPKGYVYIIFESEKQVRSLLTACNYQEGTDPTSGTYYFKISSKRIKSKDVEVIPWIIADSNYVKSTSQKLDPTKTVFVGALHGKLTAEGLAKIMNDLFEGVVYAGNIKWDFFFVKIFF